MTTLFNIKAATAAARPPPATRRTAKNPSPTILNPSPVTPTHNKIKNKAKKDERTRGFAEGARKHAHAAWQCASGCGACCKLDKGPEFPAPEEIFADDAESLRLYKSIVGADGWCVHYERDTRTCSIYEDRPFFCRVEADILEKLYGVRRRKFDKEACRFCRDTIRSVYGSGSEELKNFNCTIRNSERK